ncbi:MAG: hypothetical protein ACPG7F_18460 [Aggregatilineales bacterium]
MQKAGLWLRRTILIGLISVLVSVVSTELFLTVIDPWGVRTYFHEIEHIQQLYTLTERGYVLPSGVHDFKNWSVTINDANMRYIPANTPPDEATCQVAFVGDSVTFGYGVNDADMWVNLIARDFPQIHFLNTGVPGYNSVNVRHAIENIPADGYLYLLIENDAEPDLSIKEEAEVTSAIRYYLHVLRETQRQTTEQTAMAAVDTDITITDAGLRTLITNFETAVQAIFAMDNVIAFGFDDNAPTQYIAARYDDLILIPPFSESISVVDPHPTVASNREVAAAILPYLPDFFARVCPDISEAD